MTTTETTSTSWFSRIGNSIKNIFVGFLLIIGAIVLLFWNEGRMVKTEQGLNEGLSTVVSVSADKKDVSNEGKLIHFSGKTVVPNMVADETFGVSGYVLKMKRIVEVYQWKEKSSSKTTEKLGGGTDTTTTYTYEKAWSDSLIDSSTFKEAQTHQNPSSIPFENKEWISPGVSVGAYTISEDLLASLSGYQPFTLTQEMLNTKTSTPSTEIQLVNNTIYYQTQNIALPEIGNVRVLYEVISPQDISVVYKQSGITLVPYQTKNGSTINMIQLGKLTAEEMFKKAKETNILLTWILRAVGVILMYVGFQLIFGLLPVLGSIIPFIGSIVGMGVGLVSGLLTILFSSVVIALAWIAYRPIIGITLLIIAGASFIFLIKKSKK